MDDNLINQWKKELKNLPVSDSQDKFLTEFVEHLEVYHVPRRSQAFLSKGQIALQENIESIEGVSDEALKAEAFFHEVGHHIAFLMNKTPEERQATYQQYQDYRRDSSLSYEDFYELSIFRNEQFAFWEQQFKDCVTSKEKNSILGFMKNGVVVDNSKEYLSLSHIGQELKWIYHEQFAESFAFTMIKKLYPDNYETLLKERIISRESEQQFFATSSVDEAPKSFLDEKPFVHKIARALHAYTSKLNENPQIVDNFSHILDEIRPVAEKYTMVEAKELMTTHNIEKYFPEELKKEVLEIVKFDASTVDAVKDNIKQLRRISRLLDDDLFNDYLEGNDKKKPSI